MDKKLHALVMAGGFGTRLRPLTDRIPKPLAPIGDESAVEVVLNMLKGAGVSDAVLTLMYKGDMIEKALGEKYNGISLSYIYEKEALGTAGSVKNAADFLRGCENFIVASGDAVCDFDLSGAIEYHREKKALVTIVLTKKEDAREYGIVLGGFDINGRGEITSFIEKPPYAMTYSDLVNTGIYIMSERILELIPENQKYDFARDLFPRLIGKGLFGYLSDGYWCDIGDVAAYKRCLYDAAAGRINTAKKCRISGKGNIVSGGCRIAENARVSNSILHAGVTICESSEISDSILCENALVEENSRICANSVIGAGSVICAGSYISGAKLAEGSIAVPSSKIIEESERPLPLCRGKIEGIDKNDIPYLAAAILHVIGNGSVGIMWKDTKPHTADALLNVLGEHAVILGEGHFELAAFSARELELSFVIFIQKEGHLTFLNRAGLLVSREYERKMISNFKNHDPKKADTLPSDLSESLLSAYLCELCESADNTSLSNICISFSDSARTHPLSHALRRLGASPRKENEEGYHVEFSESGSVRALYECKSGAYYAIGSAHIAALLILHKAQFGERIPLPFDAPKILDTITQSVGAVPYRYTENDASESSVPDKISSYISDSSMALISLLCHLKESGASLEDECKKLPEFVFVKSRAQTSDRFSDALMRDMIKDGAKTGDGVRIEYPHGSFSFTPSGKNEAVITCDAESESDVMEIISDVSKKYSVQEK